ncbi:MAG: aromatic-ring-hydroxylating dioxygenase subunit beta [Steroidobacteraceae bacterium]
MNTRTSQESVERFLYEEAELIDRWKLTEWEALFTADAEYLIPPIGLADAENASHESALFVIADDREALAARVERLSGKSAFAETPRSNLRHMISNVRILSEEGDELSVAANFCVYRIRRADITQYIGQFRYRLLRSGTSFKIRRKSVLMDIDVLRGQGGIGFIL